MKFALTGTGEFAITGWSYVSIEDGGGIPCQNCGKLITTHVTVNRNDGKIFTVGSDCAKTLSGVNKSEVNEIERLIRSDARKLRELKVGNYFFVEEGDLIRVLRYSTESFSRERYFSINMKCYISKKVFGSRPLTTPEDVKAIAPELLDTYGYKTYFLNQPVAL
jgi:hypothetical protein